MLLTVIQHKTNYILDDCHSKGIARKFVGIPMHTWCNSPTFKAFAMFFFFFSPIACRNINIAEHIGLP